LDGDGVCADLDPCPADPQDDSDGDGTCDSDDRCAGFDDTLDLDANGIADGCEGRVLLCDQGWQAYGPGYNYGYSYSSASCGIPGDENTSYFFEADTGTKVPPYDAAADLAKGHSLDNCCDFSVHNGATQVDTLVPSSDFASVSCNPLDGYPYTTNPIYFTTAYYSVICLQTAPGRYVKYIGLADCCGGVELQWEATR
jgi:hypothetical protein